MREALSPLLLAAARVVLAAAVAKLRDPSAAATALATLEVPVPGLAVRALAGLELTIAVMTIAWPGRVSAAALAGLYAAFGAVSWLLRRRHAECGCFGDGGLPASTAQTALSTALACIAALAASSPPRGVAWTATHPAVAIGAAGLAYALVIAYTELPRAWSAWGAR